MPKERCAALVYATGDQLHRPEYSESGKFRHIRLDCAFGENQLSTRYFLLLIVPRHPDAGIQAEVQ